MAKMMDCPKCRFNQPEDTFCANCGVDMPAFSKRTEPDRHRWTKMWQYQALLAVIAILLVGQLLAFFGVKSSAINNSVEQVLMSIDLFSQPSEVSRQELLQKRSSFNESESQAKGSTQGDGSPSDSGEREPANEAAVQARSGSIRFLSEAVMAEITEVAGVQMLDDKLKLASLDPNNPDHARILRSVRAAKNILSGTNDGEDVQIRTRPSQFTADRIELIFRRVDGDGISQPNYLITYASQVGAEAVEWEKPAFLPEKTISVIFGLVDDQILQAASSDRHPFRIFRPSDQEPAENSVIAVVIE